MMASLSERVAAPRRTLATRNAGWAKRIARRLAGTGVRPNDVSIAGVLFALASATAFYLSSGLGPEGRAVLLVAAAACIQLRLLCNLLDGMLAVEEGLKSATGEIFNDLPDRIADVVRHPQAAQPPRSDPDGIPPERADLQAAPTHLTLSPR